MKQEQTLDERLERNGVSRRDFLKYCSILSATLGLSSSFGPKIAEALTSSQRPPVVWLAFAECTGCAESTLRTSYPWIDQLLLDIISMDYHETIMAPSGEAAEKSLHDTITKHEGKFICVVDGSIPTADNGVYGMIGGRTMLEIAKEVCPKAMATICIGSCASYGGLPAGAPQSHGSQVRQRRHRHQDTEHPRLPAQSHQLRGNDRELSPIGQASGPGRQGASPLRLRQDHP